MVPTMVLVADDSGDANRREALCDLADAVSHEGMAPVVPAFGGRSEVSDSLRAVDGPIVVTPAFVAGGDLASAELLAGLDLSERLDVCRTEPLGAVPSIVAELARRLSEVGWTSGEGAVLAADGASNPAERRVVTDVARMLSRRLHTPVQVGYLSAWGPSVSDAVRRLRRNGRSRVAVATWRLVGGEELRDPGDLGGARMTAPLWPSSPVIETLLAQHRAATARLAV